MSVTVRSATVAIALALLSVITPKASVKPSISVAPLSIISSALDFVNGAKSAVDRDRRPTRR
jgi:hypothetical protein